MPRLREALFIALVFIIAGVVGTAARLATSNFAPGPSGSAGPVFWTVTIWTGRGLLEGTAILGFGSKRDYGAGGLALLLPIVLTAAVWMIYWIS
jgi:hypothetical protein